MSNPDTFTISYVWELLLIRAARSRRDGARNGSVVNGGP